jgi:hypothetical protein
MQGRFEHIETLLQAFVAGVADFSARDFSSMVLAELANGIRSAHHFGVRFEQLRLELSQKFLTLLLNHSSIRNRIDHRL